jgi:hypothetical protein
MEEVPSLIGEDSFKSMKYTAGAIMDQMQSTDGIPAHPQPQDRAKLIRKLRWIGMDDEARLLERATDSLPPDERGTVSAGPFSTD